MGNSYRVNTTDSLNIQITHIQNYVLTPCNMYLMFGIWYKPRLFTVDIEMEILMGMITVFLHNYVQYVCKRWYMYPLC